MISELPLFSKINQTNISSLMKHIKIQTLTKSDIVHKSGDIPGSLYIVKEGEVAAMKEVIVEESNIWPQSNKEWCLS